MRGRFKAHSNQITELLAYTVAATALGLQPGLWTSRLMETLENHGLTTGWLFQDADGSQRKMSSFGDPFYSHLLAL